MTASSTGCSRCLEVCGNDLVIGEPPPLDAVAPQYGDKQMQSMDHRMSITSAVSREQRHSVASVESMPEIKFEEEPQKPEKKRKNINQTCPCFSGSRVRLDELTVLDRSWWCTYCICGGCGCTREAAALHLAAKCTCCLQRCENSDCLNHDGLCMNMYTCCCSTWLCQCPPRKDTPRCVCCNCWCCGLNTGSRDPQRDDPSGGRRSIDSSGDAPGSLYDVVVHQNSLLYYCCCCGCGLTPTSCCACCDIATKCMCCRCTTKSAPLCGEEGCCTWVLNCYCCHMQCRIPVSCDHNPVCACCGARLKPVRKQRGIGISKPSQQEMK